MHQPAVDWTPVIVRTHIDRSTQNANIPGNEKQPALLWHLYFGVCKSGD